VINAVALLWWLRAYEVLDEIEVEPEHMFQALRFRDELCRQVDEVLK
jgi:hypothetical protein